MVCNARRGLGPCYYRDQTGGDDIRCSRGLLVGGHCTGEWPENPLVRWVGGIKAATYGFDM